MNILILKLVLAPVIIGSASLAGRKWGPASIAILRVTRGAKRPSDAELRSALMRDRVALALDAKPIFDQAVAGPYPVVVDGVELDEYVVWER